MRHLHLFAAVGGFLLFGAGCALSAVTPTPANIPAAAQGEVQNIRAPHFVDSAPAHGNELAATPLVVVINTDLELVESSSISVTVNGTVATEGEIEIDASRFSMRRGIRQDAPDGIYLVTYRACGPDQSCDDGWFSFSVDRTRQSGYQDLRGQTTVEIKMIDQRFVPEKVIISPGTHIVWINDENVPHFVSTDPFISQNYYPAQNSTVINKGENYELTLNEEGEYLYHCSAHYPSMVARIIVSK